MALWGEVVTANNDNPPFFIALYGQDRNLTSVEIPLDWEPKTITATIYFDKETGKVIKIV